MARMTDYPEFAYCYYLSWGIAPRGLYNTRLNAVVLLDLGPYVTSMPKASSIALG